MHKIIFVALCSNLNEAFIKNTAFGIALTSEKAVKFS